MKITLAILQRKADYWAAKLGVGPVRVDWLDRCPSLNGYAQRMPTGESMAFDAHCHKNDLFRGCICVAAHVSRWYGLHAIRNTSRLMRHEVAHLVGKGKHGTQEFAKAAGEKWDQPKLYGVEVILPGGGRGFRTGGVYHKMGKAGIREIVEIRRTAA